MSPQEQLAILHRQEEMMRAMQTEPTERDLEASINSFCNELVSC